MDISSHIKNNELRIIARPNSAKNEIVRWDEDKQALRVNINAEPEKGKANLEVVKFFKKLLKKDIKIKSGLTSKNKILSIGK